MKRFLMILAIAWGAKYPSCIPVWAKEKPATKEQLLLELGAQTAENLKLEKQLDVCYKKCRKIAEIRCYPDGRSTTYSGTTRCMEVLQMVCQK